MLLHLMAENRRRTPAFFEDMKRRGLNDQLLVTSDGAPGIIKAVEVCFPRAARQHRMRNPAAKLPEEVAGVQSLRAGGLSGAEPSDARACCRRRR